MRNLLIKAILWHLRLWAIITLLVHKPYIIGIAGSVGKSSTRNALHAVLKNHFKVKVVSGNSETGVPIGILGLKLPAYENREWLRVMLKAPFQIFNLRNTQYLIVEMGIDDPFPPKNMDYLLTIVKPDMAIDLNVTATHTMQFEKLLTKNVSDRMNFLLKKIAFEDSKIITKSNCKIAIYNKNDKYLREEIEKNSNIKAKILTFGDEKDNDIVLGDYEVTSRKSKFTFNFEGQRAIREITLNFSNLLLPPAYKETLGAVLLACRELELTYPQIKDAIEANYHLPPGRSTIFEGYKNSMLIDSTYNSSKESVLSFLEMLKILKRKTGRKVIFVMGDMRELGNESKSEHNQVAEELISVVDELYCVGPNTLEYVVPIAKNAISKRKGKIRRVEWYKNAVQLALHLKEELDENAIILFKGSQNEIFLEEAVKFLLQNPQDAQKIARQDEYWLRVKKNFFSI